MTKQSFLRGVGFLLLAFSAIASCLSADGAQKTKDKRECEDYRRLPDADAVSLGFGHTDFGDDDVKLLKSSKRLKSLDLGFTRITDVGFRELCGQSHPELESLGIEGTNITNAGLGELRRGLYQKLRSLGIAGAKITDGGMAYLGSIPTLRELSLGRVGDAGLMDLRQLKELQDLGIEDDNLVTDAGMEYIGRFTSLESLSLSGDNITDRGMVHLRNLKNLRYATINCKNVTDVGLANLGAVEQLESLEVYSDRMTGVFLQAFHYDDDSHHPPGIGTISLAGTSVNDSCLKSLNGFRSIASLDISKTDLITNEGLKGLEGREIGGLAISGRRITDAGLKHIGKMVELRVLDLTRNSIKGPGLEYLRHIQFWCPEWLGGTAFGSPPELRLDVASDETLKYAAMLPDLGNLVLKDPRCTDTGYGYLRRSKSLDCLDIDFGFTRAQSDKYCHHVDEILDRKVHVLDFHRWNKRDPEGIDRSGEPEVIAP